MGAVVFWTIVRTTILIPVLWILFGIMDYQLWWLVSFTSFYGVVIHPAIIHFRLFEENNKEVIESTLCSSCRHFDKTAVLCTKYDEHPDLNYLPCEGLDWEPVSRENESNINN
jgi:hypothetical protein